MKEQTVSFTTRLPKTLHRKAKKLAKEERRSLNKQIEMLVEKWEREASQHVSQAMPV
jgi:hypothetical protein